MASTASSAEDESDYERRRRENIEANARLLLSLGLDTAALTQRAIGNKAPLQQITRRHARTRRAPPAPIDPALCRRSARLEGATPVDYTEPTLTALGGAVQGQSSFDERSPKRFRVVEDTRSPTAIPTASGSGNAKSCKNLQADVQGLKAQSLGKIIPPLGGQVKRAAMEALSGEGPPTFSRMSGIQEWANAVALFVNIYGDGYKNVFLKGGREITWFGQNTQWEGSPVIQRLIHSGGADVTYEDGSTASFDDIPVVLFCRVEGCGYVFCGELEYVAHEPQRIPIRFVWRLADYDKLKEMPDFQDVIEACKSLVGTEAGE
eukprot:m.197838 g.197838  ORF g.197838 m.197838 type:complete len:320 (-) comp20244_c0_seq1:87-1046(-)